MCYVSDTHITFVYGGDIWLVAKEGGKQVLKNLATKEGMKKAGIGTAKALGAGAGYGAAGYGAASGLGYGAAGYGAAGYGAGTGATSWASWAAAFFLS